MQDYSLLVVEERADGDAQLRKVYLGIIDIWQDWSLRKRLERLPLASRARAPSPPTLKQPHISALQISKLYVCGLYSYGSESRSYIVMAYIVMAPNLEAI